MSDILVSFLAGIFAFFSPCIIPVFPVFIGMLTRNTSTKFQSILSTGLFCLGFSISFVLMGATASLLGNFLNQNFHWIDRILACIIVILGMHSCGIIHIPILDRTISFSGSYTAFFLGLTFGFGWSPCSGPILGSILMLASSKESVLQGMSLLLAYSFGIAVPFILFSTFFNQFEFILANIKKHSEKINKVGGILLIIFGIYRLVK